MRIKRYQRELCDSPDARLDLKIRVVRAEAIEVLLYGCVMWTTRQEQNKKLCTVHHRVLLRIIGARRQKSDHRLLSYNRVLELTECESVEAIVRTRKPLWTGALIHMDGGRLPKRAMLGKLGSEVKQGGGGHEKDWTACVDSNIWAFYIQQN